MSTPHSPDPFPLRLRMARDLRSLSQGDLAKRTGFAQPSISAFEGGKQKPSYENLIRLVDALGVSADYLMGRVEDPTGTTGETTIDHLFAGLNEQGRQAVRVVIEALQPGHPG